MDVSLESLLGTPTWFGPILIILLALSLSAPLVGAQTASGSHPLQTPPVWSQPPLQAVYNVSARSNASATWLAGVPSKGLVFGGLGCGGVCGDTWVFANDGGALTWFIVDTPSPHPREGAALAFDPLLNVGILFGGRDNSTYYNDTWEYDGYTDAWSPLHTPASPPRLAFASMVWDANLSSMVLFGGQGPGGAPSNATWLFQRGTWVELPVPHAPAGRWGSAFGYNPVSGSAVLFGGTNGTVSWNDTWSFSNRTWTQESPTVAPSARYAPASTVTAGGYLLLFGGFGEHGVLNDTWLMVNGTWQNLTGEFTPGLEVPPAVGGGSFVSMPSIRANLFEFFGGIPSHYDTIVPWELFVPSGGTPGGLSFQISASAVRGVSPLTVVFSTSPSGGFPPYNFSWNFGPGLPVAYGPQVSHAFNATVEMSYTVTLTVTDSEGNRASTSVGITVLPAPVPPVPPPQPPWLLLGVLWVSVGMVAFGLFYETGFYVNKRREDRLALGAFRKPRRAPYPLSLLLPILGLLRYRDFSRLRTELRNETLRWSQHFYESDSYRRWRASVFSLAQIALGVIVRLLLVVTLVFILVEMVTPPSDTSYLTYLMDWKSAVVTFYTGSWLQVDLPYVLGKTGLSVSVLTLIGPTLELGLVSLALSLLISYPLGLASGWKRGHSLDNATRAYSAFGLFWPTVVLALYFLGWFYLTWIHLFGAESSVFGLMPENFSWYQNNMGGFPSWITPYFTTTPTGFPLIDAAWHGAWLLEAYVAAGTLLQSLIIALIYSSIYLRYIRTSSAESAEEPDVVAARSRGVRERTLLWKHASRRALPLYVSAFSTTFGAFLITLTVVQVVFQDVGLGTSAWNALSGGVYPDELVSLVYLFTIAVVITNAISDIVIRALDPRISNATGGEE